MRARKGTTAESFGRLGDGRRAPRFGQERRCAQGAALAVGLALASCAADDGSTGHHEDHAAELPSAGSAGELGEVAQALNDSVQSNARTYAWAKNQPDVVLAPRDTHVCFLTEINGQLDGHAMTAVHRSTVDIHELTPPTLNNEWASTVNDDDGQTWKLGGYSIESNGLHSEATCIPLSNFTLDEGLVAWVSSIFTTPIKYGSSSADMWAGDAASFLTGIAGQFNGGDERAEVVFGTGTTLSQLRMKAGSSSSFVGGNGASLFVGVPGSGEAFDPYIRYANDNSEVKLMRTRQGACFLTKVSGNFKGSEERIRIFPKLFGNEEFWMLEAHAGRGSAYGGAACIPYVRNPIQI